MTLLASRTRADDAEVDAETILQAYDVDSPSSALRWSRRRLTQTLALRYVKPLAQAAPHEPPAPSLQAHLRLRLNQEFGSTCSLGDETCFAVVNPERRGSYTPVVSDGLLDLPFAYVEASDLPYGLRARAGRQLHTDVIGFVRIDGVSLRSEPSHLVAFESVFGALVRRQSVAGVDAFVPTGAARFDHDSLERMRAPYLEPERTTWVADGSVELGEERIVRMRVTYRALLESGGVIERRAGAGVASQPIAPLRMDAHGVVDLLDGTLVDAQAGTSVFAEPWHARAELARHVPRFDPSSIWAYFDVAPLWLASLRCARSFTPFWDVSLALRGRRTELEPAPDHDLGVEAGTSLRSARSELGLMGFAWDGGSGPLWGATLSGLHRLSSVLTLEAELSLMRIDDPLRRVMEGVSLFELAGVRVAVTEESELRVVATHSHSGPVGHRLSMLAFVHVGAWR